jgi:hypothetical protein
MPCDQTTAAMNYSHFDFVIVSLRVSCSTEMMLRRVFDMYNPRKIYYITAHGNECSKLQELMHDKRFACLDERSLLPATKLKEECKILVKDSNKSFGWYMQQFVKLGVSRYIPELSDIYVVFDADNMLVYPLQLVDNSGQVTLPYRSKYSNGYDVFYEQAFHLPSPKRNYVVGYMIMNKTIVNEMLDFLDLKWGAHFPLTICKIAERTQHNKTLSLFSEYFFYASWLKSKYPDTVKSEYPWDPVRNPGTYHSAASKGACCLSQDIVCNRFNSKEDFYVIIEEHKYRFRDKLCNDGWSF